MQHPAWLLVILGTILAGAGLVWLVAPQLRWLGKLPGDIRIEGARYQFFFPVATCLLLSVLLSGILWIVRQFVR